MLQGTFIQFQIAKCQKVRVFKWSAKIITLKFLRNYLILLENMLVVVVFDSIQ